MNKIVGDIPIKILNTNINNYLKKDLTILRTILKRLTILINDCLKKGVF